MRVLEPNTVTIIPTNTCTAACRHCSMNSGPTRSYRLSGDRLEKIFDQLFAASDVSVVVFSGGESTLVGEDLNRALRTCKAHCLVSRLVTNAYWAVSVDAALDKLRELRAAGLDELNISTDDFHLPYVSLQKVKNAFQAASQIDFQSVVICNAYGPDSWLTPDRLNAEFGAGGDLKMRFDGNGKSIVHEQRAGETMIMLSNGVAMQLGRGVQGIDDSELVKHGPGDGWHELYQLAEQIGGCPWAIRSATISARGNLLACCGTEVDGNPILDYGSLEDHTLDELLDIADNDLITNMISVLGPVKIKQLLERIAPGEIVFRRKSYRGYCEVCEDLIKIEKNRQALYKYQGLFAHAVTQVREAYKARFAVDGKVRVPPGTNFILDFDFLKPGEPQSKLDAHAIPFGGQRPAPDPVAPPAEPAEPVRGSRPRVMLPVVP